MKIYSFTTIVLSKMNPKIFSVRIFIKYIPKTIPTMNRKERKEKSRMEKFPFEKIARRINKELVTRKLADKKTEEG